MESRSHRNPKPGSKKTIISASNLSVFIEENFYLRSNPRCAQNMEHTSNTKHTRDGQDTLWALVQLVLKGLMPNYKNIKIHEETHERLQSHGNMDESFDDLINRILDDWEEQKNDE